MNEMRDLDHLKCWHVFSGETWIGPYSVFEIHEKIIRNEITWVHYIWKKGEPCSKRICDVSLFQASLPQQPTSQPVSKCVWYLHDKHSQMGPYSVDEVHHFYTITRIDSTCYVWKNGMANWERLDKISEFQFFLKKKSHLSQSTQKERRCSLRRPLIAKIIIAQDESVLIGMCRDISVGGVQVLLAESPGKVGTKLKMNISSSGGSEGIEPFVAVGVIVRILTDDRGFSFRFEKISDQAQNAIRAYTNRSFS